MFASLPARLALIAILVFSQALYAGHSVKHDSGNQPDCRICLQTSASGAALPSADFAPAGPQAHLPVCGNYYLAPAIPAFFTLAHPSRAPPSFPV
ncbi:MAG: hypothetical protein OEW92_14085 [Gammaproteobacteria bacterium]|mgnify:FL=1|nr:hypothetical protein [Gammaproteobacteria bacterium]